MTYRSALGRRCRLVHRRHRWWRRLTEALREARHVVVPIRLRLLHGQKLGLRSLPLLLQLGLVRQLHGLNLALRLLQGILLGPLQGFNLGL